MKAITFSRLTAVSGFALLWSPLMPLTTAELIITEVASKGTSGVCEGRDWVEIFNNDDNTNSSVDLFADGYMLHDNKGMMSDDAYFFPEGTVMEAGEYLLLCTKTSAVAPQFGIGSADTVTLATTSASASGSVASAGRAMGYTVVSSVGPLPRINVIEGFDVAYALNTATGVYSYTSTPTPGTENILTYVGSPQEQVEAVKTQLSAQNDLGTSFFNMDSRGYPVSGAMDTVVDLRVTMLEEDFQYLLQNASYEVYRPFQSATVTTRDDPSNVLLSLTSPGRIRPKGQFTLYMPLCLGVPNFPFQLDFTETNSSQTLFGAERVYLRTHFMDNSYARDWAYYRMAARFGLPHLRARKVRLFLNEELYGLYTLLEAPDQDYVFHRNFPLYDPSNYALYKVKTLSLACGQYDEAALDRAQARLDSGTAEATPPYVFERGEHKPLVPVQGPLALTECFYAFFGSLFGAEEDAALAYLRYDKSCPDMLLAEGLVDRDLGTSGWDANMMDFIASGAFSSSIDVTNAAAVANPFDPAKWVDRENTLKMIAFYAVTLNLDSPLGNGNNVYWAQSGEKASDDGGREGWKMFPYDFNVASTLTCGPTCNSKAIHWSIVQPTCSHLSANPLVGPMLSDAASHEAYLRYVQEFVDTVYANETFVQEIQEHLQAQDADVRSDSLSAGGIFYDAELSPDASKWDDNINSFPLLATMKARATSVRAQLDAIDRGVYPRGPHGIGITGDDYETWETCPDWRLMEAPGSACPENCRYEGCHMPGWIIESSCNEETKTCVHGLADDKCEGIPDLGRYEGMEEGPGIMCLNVGGFHTKMSPCPPYEQEESIESVNNTNDTSVSKANALLLAVDGVVLVSLASFLGANYWF